MRTFGGATLHWTDINSSRIFRGPKLPWTNSIWIHGGCLFLFSFLFRLPNLGYICIYINMYLCIYIYILDKPLAQPWKKLKGVCLKILDNSQVAVSCSFNIGDDKPVDFGGFPDQRNIIG